MADTTAPLTAEPRATPGIRWIFGYGIVAGVILSVVGFVIGAWLGLAVGAGWSGADGTDQNDLALVLGYVFALLGYLGGLGFYRYPVARLRGREPSEYRRDNTEAGWDRYFRLTTDHKVVGIQYIVGALAIFLIGGVNAMLIRAELLSSNATLWTPQQYITLVGLHGALMIMTMSGGVVGGFGNYLVPLMIGARRTAFPRVQALAFWLIPFAALILISSTFVGGFPAGWTGYMPLGAQGRMGMDSYYVAFGVVAIALILVGIDLLATIVAMRAPGLTWGRLPMFVWGIFATTILMALASPMLLATVFMATLDRIAGTVNFIAPMGGSPFLWENLFWFFGHPEVYILALPGFGILLELIPVFSRKTLWGYRLGVIGLLGIALLSFTVWQHHLFQSGINSDLRGFYSASTELISIPTGFIFLCALATMFRGKLRFEVPMLFCIAFIVNFLVGGVSGVYLSDVPSNASTHGSYFVMAHFHYTIMGGLVFMLFAALYYWMPKMTGVRFDPRLSKWHFWTMFVSFNSTFLPLFAVGILGMPRRVSTYDPAFTFLNRWASISAFLLFGSMLIFIWNFVSSMVFRRVPAEQNPWGSRGLEWQVPTPVPPHDFDHIPRVLSGPYEYGVEGAPPVADLTGGGERG
jgi:cytochrome c oxidase subunit 1